jgi:hypothetical protein
MDKRNVYDWNTKIHLLARGPGIDKGVEWAQPATQVDLAPTFLGLAGVPKPPTMDGKSLVPFLVNASSPAVPSSTRQHLASLGNPDAYRASWRDSVFIEYYYVQDNVKCMEGCPTGHYPKGDSACTNLDDETECWCPPGPKHTNCYATESIANNFIAVRSFPAFGSEVGNTLYAEYETGNQGNVDINFTNPDFHELYDNDNDTWQMNNLWNKTGDDLKAKLHAKLMAFFRCSGDNCP